MKMKTLMCMRQGVRRKFGFGLLNLKFPHSTLVDILMHTYLHRWGEREPEKGEEKDSQPMRDEREIEGDKQTDGERQTDI